MLKCVWWNYKIYIRHLFPLLFQRLKVEPFRVVGSRRLAFGKIETFIDCVCCVQLTDFEFSKKKKERKDRIGCCCTLTASLCMSRACSVLNSSSLFFCYSLSWESEGCFACARACPVAHAHSLSTNRSGRLDIPSRIRFLPPFVVMGAK